MYRSYKVEEWIMKWRKFLYPDYPEFASLSEWREWRDKQKETPIRYFLAERFPDYLEDVIIWIPKHISNGMWWLRYRFAPKYRYHIINTKLKPDYHHPSEQIIYANFAILVNFVEQESAIQHRNWNDDQPSVGWFERWYFRDPGAGVARLKEMQEYNPTSPQYTEILELYKWWTEIRPQRIKPFTLSGVELFYNELEKEEKGDWLEIMDDKLSTDQKNDLNLRQDLEYKIETGYNNEDTEMLMRLINVRLELYI